MLGAVLEQRSAPGVSVSAAASARAADEPGSYQLPGLNGGTIQVKSARGVGTTVLLTLPV